MSCHVITYSCLYQKGSLIVMEGFVELYFNVLIQVKEVNKEYLIKYE